MRGQQHVFALERVDLAEDWFDDRLAPGVGTLASFGAELAGHPLLGREVLRDPTCWCRPFLLELNNPPAQSGELLPLSGGQRPTGPWPRSILACFTQFRSVSGFTPRSRAPWAIPISVVRTNATRRPGTLRCTSMDAPLGTLPSWPDDQCRVAVKTGELQERQPISSAAMVTAPSRNDLRRDYYVSDQLKRMEALSQIVTCHR